MPTTSHPNLSARKIALVPLPAATSSTRDRGVMPNICPSRSVSLVPPGWNESPNNNRAASLSYTPAQHCFMAEGETSTTSISGFIPLVSPSIKCAPLVEVERNWPRLVGATFAHRAAPLWLHGIELGSRLLAIPYGVVSAERNLLAAG